MNPTDPKEIGKKIKELIASAELDRAIKKLLEFFNDKEKYRALKNKLLLIKSMYSKTKQDEELGIKSRAETKLGYNNTSNQLLSIADALETGSFQQEEASKKVSNTNLIIGASAGVLLFILAILFNPFKLEEENLSTIQPECPNFQPAPQDTFQIIVLPFQPFDENGQIGGIITGTHNLIVRRFRTVSESAAINIKIVAISPNEFALNESYPVTFGDAEKFASKCNAQLIIWGTTENLAGQGPVIHRKFKFLGFGETFKLTRIKEAEEGSAINTIETFTTIATGSEITEDIEEVLLGIVAYENGQLETAIKLLSNVTPQDSATSLMRGMFLGDAYLSKQNDMEALKVYNEVSKIHPEYGLLANNQGILNYRTHHYEDAIESLNVILQEKPNDTIALAYRGKAYLNAEQLNLAKIDLKKAKNLKQETLEIDRSLEKLDQKVLQQERLQQQTNQIISQTPNNIEALIENAYSNFKLGHTDKAIQRAEQALKISPRDTNALKIIIRVAESTNDEEKLQDTAQKAIEEGIDLSKTLPSRSFEKVTQKTKRRSD